MNIDSVEVVMCGTCHESIKAPMPNHRADFIRKHAHDHNVPYSQRRLVTIFFGHDERESDETKLLGAASHLAML